MSMSFFSMVMGIHFRSVPFLPFSMFVRFLSLLFSCLWIVVYGLDAYSGQLLSHFERCLGAYPVDRLKDS